MLLYQTPIKAIATIVFFFATIVFVFPISSIPIIFLFYLFFLLSKPIVFV
jgi:hypothetical protein